MDDVSVFETPLLECLVFSCCGALLGCETRHVAKIIPVPVIVPLPRASGAVAGVFNSRGRILGAIDIRTLMGVDNSCKPSYKWLVLLKGKQFVTGLLIEEITGIEAVRESELLDSHDGSPCFLTKTFMTDGRTAALLDVNMLLSDPSVTVCQ